MNLKPFWRYYGGKWRAAPRYPAPQYDTIVEPFAGAAGYSLRYADRKVVLVDAYPDVCEIWRWLISASPAQIKSIPCNVESLEDLPTSTPLGALCLIGFHLSAAVTSPRLSLSAGRRKMAQSGRRYEGWTPALVERVCSQIEHIRHWRIIEGDYTCAPDVEATWFIDPPYNNRAGSHYMRQVADYGALADWCRNRRGQVTVCENEGADWLPFEPFATLKPGINGKGSREVLWTNGEQTHMAAKKFGKKPAATPVRTDVSPYAKAFAESDAAATRIPKFEFGTFDVNLITVRTPDPVPGRDPWCVVEFDSEETGPRAALHCMSSRSLTTSLPRLKALFMAVIGCPTVEEYNEFDPEGVFFSAMLGYQNERSKDAAQYLDGSARVRVTASDGGDDGAGGRYVNTSYSIIPDAAE